MMKFRTVKAAMLSVLGDSANGRFIVIGYQRQSKSAEDVLANNRLVQVYYNDGDFPKNAGGYHGSKSHDMVINIDVTVAAKASADLTILNSENATEKQRSVALAAVQTAAEKADDQIDEIIDVLYQIIMDARNDNLGLDTGTIANRWIDRIQKDIQIEHGGLVVKVASMKYSCRVSEDVPGDDGTEPDTVTYDSDVMVGDTEGSGVEVENDNT